MTANTLLRGRVALITGASSGLGRHFAATLAAAGARVAVVARRKALIEELAEEIKVTGAEALAVSMDVTKPETVAEAFDAVADQLGQPEIVVNNAGTAIGKPVLDMMEEDWDRVIDTNLKGAWIVAQEAGRRMRDAETGGSIINIASILAFRVSPGVAPYAISKAGVVQMTKAMAMELARFNIRVNALAPGYVETDLNRDFLDTEVGRRTTNRIPMRRVGQVTDLNGPLLLLASDASSYMTGAVIPVDGGHLVSSL